MKSIRTRAAMRPRRPTARQLTARQITAWLIAAALCAAALLLFAAAAHKRTAVYRYDVSADARLDFGRTRVSRVSAVLANGRLLVPARAGARDVVLLGVRVRSTLLGRWFEPRLEIEADGRRFTQTFERGGSGLRHVNLSPLGLQSETTVLLHGRYLGIGDQQVTLYYLPSDLDPDRQSILVVSPHPDDAEIAAFGLYAGRNAYVVTVTAGEAGDTDAFPGFEGAAAHIAKGRTRVWNSLTVPMLGGLEPGRTANLGYFDGTLEAMAANPQVEVHSPASGAMNLDAFRSTHAPDLILPDPDRRATQANLVDDLAHVVQRVQPDIIVAPYPLIDLHSDHKMTTAALLAALKKLHWTRGALLLYSNHLPSNPLYPYGDAGDLVSPPPGIDGIVFDGMYSNPLSAENQALKHTALDAMIDLRPAQVAGSAWSAAGIFLKTLLTEATGRDDSYFRRAVRADEFFLEIRMPSLYEPGITERIEGISAPGEPANAGAGP